MDITTDNEIVNALKEIKEELGKIKREIEGINKQIGFGRNYDR